MWEAVTADLKLSPGAFRLAVVGKELARPAGQMVCARDQGEGAM